MYLYTHIHKMNNENHNSMYCTQALHSWSTRPPTPTSEKEICLASTDTFFLFRRWCLRCALPTSSIPRLRTFCAWRFHIYFSPGLVIVADDQELIINTVPSWDCNIIITKYKSFIKINSSCHVNSVLTHYWNAGEASAFSTKAFIGDLHTYKYQNRMYTHLHRHRWTRCAHTVHIYKDVCVCVIIHSCLDFRTCYS